MPESRARKRTVGVLAIDGGGVRGLIPALILAEIEKRCGRPVGRIFDVIAGTSNGAVMTMLLTRPQPHPASEVVRIYSDDSHEFFRRGFWHSILSVDGWLRPKYPAGPIEATLRRFIGETAELKDAVTEVVAAAYSLRATWPRVVLFSRHQARTRPGCNFRMWEVARASCAAPGYFPGPTVASLDGHRIIHPIDGGVYANDPAVVGLCHALSLEPEKERLIDGSVEHLLLSLGTGIHDEPILPGHARNWGLLGWAPHIVSVMFEGQTDLAEREIWELLPSTPALRRHWRLQVTLSRPSALDDVRPENIAFLRESTARFIDRRSPEIDQMCRELAAC